jgi:hypothetical protein
LAAEDRKKSQTYTPDNPENLEVVIDQPALKYFGEGHAADVLIRHLQASPEWRVFQESPFICHRRKLDNGFWLEGGNGYENGDVIPIFEFVDMQRKKKGPRKKGSLFENRYQILYLFRFAKESGFSHPMLPKPRHYTEAHPDAKKK